MYKADLEAVRNPKERELIEQDTVINPEESVVLSQEQPSLTDETNVAVDAQPATTQERLALLKLDSKVILDAMNQNLSFFNKAAAFWAIIPLWLQLIVVTSIIAALLLPGILFSITSLIVVSVAVFLVYSVFSFLFYNHNLYNVRGNDKIQEEINKLLEILDEKIQNLEKQTIQIGHEIDQLQKENDNLEIELEQLSQHRAELSQQSDYFCMMTQDVDATNNNLQNTVDTLNNSIVDHTEQSTIYLKMKQQLKIDVEENRIDLSKKIVELIQVKIDLNKELEKLNKFNQLLKAVVEEAKTSVFENKQDQNLFQEKLNAMFDQTESIVSNMAQRIKDAQHELLIVNEALKLSKSKREQLLRREDAAITRLAPHFTTAGKHGFFVVDDDQKLIRDELIVEDVSEAISLKKKHLDITELG